jgi:AsmA protein
VRFLKAAGLLLVGLVIVVVAVLMFGVPAGPLAGYLGDQVEKAGYQLRINGSSRIALWPYLSVAANDVRVLEKANAQEELFTAAALRVGVSLSGLLSGDIRVTEIEIEKPVIRLTSGRPGSGRLAGRTEPKESILRNVAIDRVTVTDGTLIMRDLVENIEGRIDAVQVTAAAPAKCPVDVKAEGRAGTQILRVAAKASSLSELAESRPTLLDARVELPGLLKSPLAFTANLKIADQVVSVDGMRGSLGNGRVTGTIAIDTGKARPNANANLSFDRLELAPEARPAPAGSKADEPWSDQPLELVLLRVFDATVKVSMRELAIGTVQIAPAEIDANLAGGLLLVTLTRAQLYGGPIQGRLVVDADRRDPRHGVSFQFSGIEGLPFLKDAVGFDKLEGRFNAKFELTANGASAAKIVSSLGGTAELALQNGAIRDVNVPSMVRLLSNQILQGWQGETEKTAFGTLSATFRIANGQAATDDVRLVGPLIAMTGRGSANLVDRTLDFRVDPKLVLVPQGQGSAANPAGLGVPVVIKGSWSNPQIYPDIAGILENPAAAFDKLKTLGGGLIGLLQQPDASGRKQGAGDVMQRLDDVIRGGGNRQGDGGRVQDVIRDLFRR